MNKSQKQIKRIIAIVLVTICLMITGAIALAHNNEIFKPKPGDGARWKVEFTSIAEGEKTKIKAIAIYSPKQVKCMPCGACRQWLSEFALDSQETKIILEDDNNQILVLTLEEIFPCSFKFVEN